MTVEQSDREPAEKELLNLMKDIIDLATKYSKLDGVSLDELIDLLGGLRQVHLAEYHTLDPLPPFESTVKMAHQLLVGYKELLFDSHQIKVMKHDKTLHHFHEQAKRIMNGNPTEEDFEEIGYSEMKQILDIK